MKSYPSISKEILLDIPIVMQPKYDGSCIRIEYSKKQGFYKFGSRKRLIDESEPILGEAISIFKNEMAESLSELFKKKKFENIVLFGEFFGDHSQFGRHVQEKHKLILFDVDLYKYGQYGPLQFYDLFQDHELFIAPLIYKGCITESLVEEIRLGNLIENWQNPDYFEGVVCKTLDKKNPEMFKIKTYAWKEKLRTFCGADKKLLTELE